MNATDKLEMQLNVQEASDGSAVVELPEDMDPIDQTPPEPDISEHNGFVNNRNDDDEGDVDPEREAIRAARREERKLKRQLGKEEKRHSPSRFHNSPGWHYPSRMHPNPTLH